MGRPGLYVHIPFCRSKCPYCGFYSIASISLVPRWLDALKKEIDSYQGIFPASFDSIYFGGGTPTVLTVRQIREIMDHLFRRFEFAEGTEITIEANPGDIDSDNSKELRDIGFNRINLGVQSFNDKELRFLGRRHTGRDASQAFNDLRSSGFKNIGIDLIYGLRDQTLEGWRNNIRKALAFQPEHLSCYELTIEEGTPFSGMKDKCQISTLDEEAEELFFLAASEFLEDHGFIHYEISNFAKDESSYSRHNRKYWDRTPYLGIGPSAHSFDGASRWWNRKSVRRYCEIIEGFSSPVEERETLSKEQIILEQVSLGLRTRWGFDKSLVEWNTETERNLAMLIDERWLRFDGDNIVPTKKGFLIADRLPLYFFA